jgi:hypothetical protein
MAFRWAQRASSCLMALLSFAGVTLFALQQQSLIFSASRQVLKLWQFRLERAEAWLVC